MPKSSSFRNFFFLNASRALVAALLIWYPVTSQGRSRLAPMLVWMPCAPLIRRWLPISCRCRHSGIKEDFATCILANDNFHLHNVTELVKILAMIHAYVVNIDFLSKSITCLLMLFSSSTSRPLYSIMVRFWKPRPQNDLFSHFVSANMYISKKKADSSSFFPLALSPSSLPLW